MHTNIAVALGGRDARRTYFRWDEVLLALIRHWPEHWPAPRFFLIGSGQSAAQSLRTLSESFVAENCMVALDLPDIRQAVSVINGCQAFIGADGGLMHIALALSKQGLGLFGAIRPEWRILPGAQLTSIYDEGDINRIDPSMIVDRFLRNLQGIEK
jgi:ADP-heptose:LPS heptosyltransferase